MGGKHWTDDEVGVIKNMWPANVSIKTWAHLLPGRSVGAIFQAGIRFDLGAHHCSKKPTYTQSWLCIAQLLSDKRPRSLVELSQGTGFSVRQIGRQIRDRLGTDIYISSWQIKPTEQKHRIAMFSLGNKESAKRPKPTPKATLQRNYMKRVKKHRPDKMAQIAARKSLKHAENKGKLIRVDPAAAWMMNPVK